MKTKLFFVVTLFWVLFIATTASCQQEEITLSTYYPAPFGEYDELCAEKLLVDLPSAQELQDMVRGDCHITRSLIVGTAGGGFSYDALNAAGTPLYDGDVIIEGSLGIGTRDPNAKLQINYGTEFVKQTALGVGGVTNIFLGSNTNFASGIGQAYFGITTGLANGVPLGGSGTYHWGAVTDSDNATQRLFHFGYFPDNDMTNNFVSNAWINGRNGAAYFAGNVGIGTTNPVAPLTVERNADVYLGHIIAVCSDDNDAVLALATATAAEDAAIFLDKSDSNKLKIALGNTAFTADRNTSTKLTIQQDGNLGIGTTAPNEKLDVDGNIRTTGGIKYGDLQDYRMVYRDDFQSDASGWSYTARSTFAGATILGGYNLTSNTSFYKDYNLTGIPHAEVMIRATYYAIDTWDGEWGYVQADGRCIWNRHFWYNEGGRTNIGGWTYQDGIYFAEGRTSHTGNTVRVRLGSTLDQGPSDESFGVDNVEVWVR